MQKEVEEEEDEEEWGMSGHAEASEGEKRGKRRSARRPGFITM